MYIMVTSERGMIDFQTSTVVLFKIWDGKVISSYTLLGMWLFIHVGIKVGAH